MDALRQYKRGRQFSMLRCVLSPIRVFLFRTLILKGWRDGFPGFFIAFELAVSTFLFQMELRKLGTSVRRA